MSVEEEIRNGGMIPVGLLKRSYDSVFVDANFMQPDEDHTVLFFFNEKHNILSEALESKDVDSLLETFSYDIQQELSAYGSESTKAFLLKSNEKRKSDLVMLRATFFCATEADYVMSYEGRSTVLPGVGRKISTDVQSKYHRRGGMVSLRRCIETASHILGPDGYSINILSIRPERNSIGVRMNIKRGNTISTIYNADVGISFITDRFVKKEIVKVSIEAVPKLGKDSGESAANAYKAAVSDMIRSAFSKFSFVIYKNTRYLCSNRILHRIIGRTPVIQKEDIGISYLLLDENSSDAEVADEQQISEDVIDEYGDYFMVSAFEERLSMSTKNMNSKAYSSANTNTHSLQHEVKPIRHYGL